MIEELLAAFAAFPDGAGEGGPRPGVGVEEIADILWLAARVDPAAARPPGAPAPPPRGASGGNPTTPPPPRGPPGAAGGRTPPWKIPPRKRTY
ncbi:hypothetical protein ACFXB3_30630, partial [Streptomyces sp. NPDC059447]